MKAALILFGIAILIFLIAPVIAFFRGTMELDAVKTYMLVATVLWFIVAPFMMKPKSE